MKRHSCEPPVPAERLETIRHYIESLLAEYTMTSREIAQAARISEREVCDHLDHIRKSLGRTGKELVVEPARCERCSFEFRKRTRLAPPGKCPMCHSSLIMPPLFRIG